MTYSSEQLDAATSTWREFCAALANTGADALAKTMTRDEIDLAEGVRYLTRLAGLALSSSMENRDSDRPYLWTALDPHRKMGGDNPQGLYLTAPINGTDTFRLRGSRGSARWMSIIIAHDGAAPFGAAAFLPDLEFDADGTFEIVIAPERPDGRRWLPSSEASTGVLIRQFFGSPDHVVPMDLELVNLTTTSAQPVPLSLDSALERLGRANLVFSFLVPLMQQELLDKADRLNSFGTDIGDPTSTSGGVPGGNAVTARWAVAPDEALVVDVQPPETCAYWDVQVGNVWYESFDYRHVFCGLTCADAHLRPDGGLTLVLSERDPGTANWLETAGHREGHIAIRWQLSDGDLPLPRTRVVAVEQAAMVTGLPAVDPSARSRQRHALAESFDRRFGF